MRFWKTGVVAALAIATGAAVQWGGVDTHGQVIRERDISLPLERATQVLRVFGGSRLGITIDDVDADDVKAKKLPSESGVLVQDVDSDSPASRGGIKSGDVIVEFDGERVRSSSQLRRLIQETPSGRQVAIAVVRDGQRMNLTVKPEGGSSEASVFAAPDIRVAPPAPRAPRPPRPPRAPEPPEIDVRVEPFEFNLPERFAFSLGGRRLGVGTQTLTDQLAKHLGVERGVLVTEVSENSAASKAGLRAGDVITKFNGQTVEDAGDLVREVGRAGGEVTIEIVRDRKTQTVKATIEQSRPRSFRRVI